MLSIQYIFQKIENADLSVGGRYNNLVVRLSC